jgi:hypothetical protein
MVVGVQKEMTCILYLLTYFFKRITTTVKSVNVLDGFLAFTAATLTDGSITVDSKITAFDEILKK